MIFDYNAFYLILSNLLLGFILRYFDVYTPIHHRKSGFTLIELSIVLVIIGLIVGGVLVGQDLIKAAEIRKIISTIESINTSVSTFRGKYNGIPGDIKNSAMFGLPCSGATVRDASFGRSDGNGILDMRYNLAAAGRTLGGEMIWFWRDLTYVGLITSSVDMVTCAEFAPFVTTDDDRKLYLPNAGKGFLTVYNGYNTSRAGMHFYALAGVVTNSVDGTIANYNNTPPTAYTLSPNDALSLDTKIDDSMPFSGSVRSIYFYPLGTPSTSSATACASSATAYNNSSTYSSQLLCGLEFKAVF